MAAANPYAPPLARVEDAIDVAGAEALRREHIECETCVRFLGAVCVVIGAVMLIRAAWILAYGMRLRMSLIYFADLIAPFLLLTGALALGGGVGLLRLSSWARVPIFVLTCVGLLIGWSSVRIGWQFAPAAGIGAFMAVLLLSAKGRRVFASHYDATVAATPHVGYRPSVALVLVAAAGAYVLGLFVIDFPR